MARPDSRQFMIYDVDSDFAFEFPIFPEQIRTSGRANWEPQETTMGKKPLFYPNSDPLRISIQDAVIDQTVEMISLVPDIDLLRTFHSELEEGGAPPALQAVWGDRQIDCVMESLDIEESMFVDGNPTRLTISMELVERQDENGATTVRESVYNEDVEPG